MSEQKQEKSAKQKREDLWVLRGLCLLISLVFVGRGVLAILDRHSEASTRFGYVVLDGSPAVQAGWAIVCIGLLPLGVFAPGKKWALAWCSLCVGALGFVLAYSAI